MSTHEEINVTVFVSVLSVDFMTFMGNSLEWNQRNTSVVTFPLNLLIVSIAFIETFYSGFKNLNMLSK